MRDGCLILKGIVNDNMDVDTAKYLTGGLWTKDKHAFHRGRIEVRARLHGARGAWPAIWTLPYEIDKYVWPMGGEVDIRDVCYVLCLQPCIRLYLYIGDRE